MNRLYIILVFFSTVCIAFAQTVYVTPGTSSKLYHKNAECTKLKSSGSSFSISIQQAKSFGKEACDICYSVRPVQNPKTPIPTSVTYSNIEIPSTSSRVKSQVISRPLKIFYLLIFNKLIYNSLW